MEVQLFSGDISQEFFAHYNQELYLGVDTETTGLSLEKDTLQLVQIADAKGEKVALLQNPTPASQNTVALLMNPQITKIIHYARFDVAFLQKYMGVWTKNYFCTRTMARAITLQGRHSLFSLLKSHFGVKLNKDNAVRCSGWRGELTDAQKKYAAEDVIYLDRLRQKLESLTTPEKVKAAKAAMGLIDWMVKFDLVGVDANNVLYKLMDGPKPYEGVQMNQYIQIICRRLSQVQRDILCSFGEQLEILFGEGFYPYFLINCLIREKDK